MTAFGTMPWRPLVPMGDGEGGYDSPRMSGGELDRFAGHVLVSLPGWQQSKGATLEREVSVACGIEVCDIKDVIA